MAGRGRGDPRGEAELSAAAELVAWAAFVRGVAHHLARRPTQIATLARNQAATGSLSAAGEARLKALGRPWLARDPRPPRRAEQSPTLTLSGHAAEVSSVVWGPGPQQLLTSGLDGDVRLWNARTGEGELLLRAHPTSTSALGGFVQWVQGGVSDLALHPDGRQIATIGGDGDGHLRLFALASRELVLETDGHSDEVSSRPARRARLLYLGDGSRVASVADSLRLWDVQNGDRLFELRACAWLAASDDGRFLLTMGSRTKAVLCGSATGERIVELSGHDGWVLDGALNADGSLAVTLDQDGCRARLWSLPGGELLATSPPLESGMRVGFRPWRGSTNAEWILYGQQTLWRWNPHADALEPLVPDAPAKITALAVDPVRAVVATGHADGTVRLSPLPEGAAPETIEHLPATANALHLLPDGTRAFIGCDDAAVYVWSVAEGRTVASWRGHEQAITGLAASADGATVVTVGWDNTLRAWNSESGRCTRRLPTDTARGVAASADGGTVLSWGQSKMAIWHPLRLFGRGPRRMGREHDSVRAAWLSRDGSRAVSFGKQSALRLWSVADGGETRELPRPRAMGDVLAVDDRGAAAATTNFRGSSLYIWDLASSICRLRLMGHRAPISGAAFSLDGRLVTTAGRDGEIRVWRVSDGRCLALYLAESPVRALSNWASANSFLAVTEDRGVHALRLVEAKSAAADLSPDEGRVWGLTRNQRPNRETMRVEEQGELVAAGTLTCPACDSRRARFRPCDGFESHSVNFAKTAFDCTICGWEWFE